jgi:hypothetical protein
MAYKYYYHDDPDAIEEPNTVGRFTNLLASIAILLTAGFFIQSTLAANISLGTSPASEFGQGILQTTACSQGQALLITPKSEFANASGAGSYKFSSFTVSNIPSSCNGVDFSLSAYDSATGSSALPLFNSAASTAVIYNNSGTYESNVSAGLTITTLSSTSFRATFDSPVTTANAVLRLTIQSGPHVPLPCAQGGVCTLGQTGPGGGKIFYVNASGFSCGPTLALTCKYLEAAPNTWAGGSSDPAYVWADAGTSSTLIGATAQRTAIGAGYANTMAIVNQPNSTSTSAGAVRAYTGGGLNDWYLGNVNEMIELDNSQAYVSPVVQNYYATSEETNATFRRIYGMVDNSNWSGHSKNTNNISYTRPIRAF